MIVTRRVEPTEGNGCRVIYQEKGDPTETYWARKLDRPWALLSSHDQRCTNEEGVFYLYMAHEINKRNHGLGTVD